MKQKYQIHKASAVKTPSEIQRENCQYRDNWQKQQWSKFIKEFETYREEIGDLNSMYGSKDLGSVEVDRENKCSKSTKELLESSVKLPIMRCDQLKFLQESKSDTFTKIS